MKNRITFTKFVQQYASPEWILLIENYLTLKTCKKDERIFNQGDDATGVYFINSGKVKVTSRYDNTNERILRLSHEGHFLGHRAFHTDKFPVSGVALTQVEVTHIPKDIFVKFIKANPEFAIHIIEFFSKDLLKTEERMKCMIHQEVIIRISNIILMLIEAYGYDAKNSKKLEYVLSRSDMANFAGTTYESVIRNLGRLEELKLIVLENKSIIVPSEDALHEFINKST